MLATPEFGKTAADSVSAPAASAARTEVGGLSLGRWLWLGSMVVWLVFLQVREWPPFGGLESWPLARVDSAAFAMAGELLREGGVPYLAYWDHKPPVAHLLDAGALWISGGRTWAIWVLNLLVVLGVFLLGYRTLVRGVGVWPAVLGMSFFTFALAPVFAANHTETYVLPLQWLAVMLLLQLQDGQRHFMRGCLLGAIGTVSFLLRPNLLGTAAAVAIVASLLLLLTGAWRPWRRLAAGSVAGALLVAVPVAGYLWWEGALAAFFDQVFRYNYLYASSTWKLRLRALLRGVELLSSNGALLLPIAGWLWAVISLPHASTGSRPLLLLGALWLPIEVVLATLAGRSHANYFLPVLAPLAFCAALLGFAILASVPASIRRRSVAAVGYALLAGMAVAPAAAVLLDVRDHGLRATRMAQVASTVEYLRAHSEAQDRIFVWGHAADLYLLSERRPATRYIYPLPLLTPGYADATLVEGFLAALDRAAPALIVDASSPGTNRRPGEDLVPSLERWDPGWRVPDPRKPEHASWRGPSYWSMTPELKAFYDYVHGRYREVARVGERGWVIYERLTR